MITDLKRFYDTCHRIYLSLLKAEQIAVKDVYQPNYYHPSQFSSLIRCLKKTGLIETSSNQDYPDFSYLKKGEQFEAFKNWLPDDSTTIANRPPRYEYYFVYLEYPKHAVANFSFSSQVVPNSTNVFYLIPLITNSELFKYCIGISKGGGREPLSIGNKTLPRIIPSKLLVFNLAKSDGYSSLNTLDGFNELYYKIQSGSEITLEKLNQTGVDVTRELGYDLNEIKLPSFETIFRLTNLFPGFEKDLLKELDLPTNIGNKEVSFGKDSDVLVSERKQTQEIVLEEDNTTQDERPDSNNNSPGDTGNLNEEQGTEFQTNSVLFRYGLYYSSIKDDKIEPCFNVETIAAVFTEHLSKLEEQSGQMVGIFGKWGRGKTYFKREVEKIIKAKSFTYKFKIIDFHAWKYQDTPAIWAYLYELLSIEYMGKNWFVRLLKKQKLNFKREGSKVFSDMLFIGFIWGILVLILSQVNIADTGLLGSIIHLIKDEPKGTFVGGTFLTYLFQFLKKEGTNARELLKKYTKGISFNQHLGVQAEIEKELVTLLKAWIPKDSKERIILFVDDIDRCSEKKIIELVDSLRVMLEHPEIIKRVIVLVAVDEEKLSMAIRYKYKELYPQTTENAESITLLTREYLDKLFISGIKLQPLTQEDKKAFVATLIKQDWKDSPVQLRSAQTSTQESVIPNKKTSVQPTGDSEAEQDEIQARKQSDVSENADDPQEYRDLSIQIETELAELSADDVINIFAEEFRDMTEELTPRQIRILYYRFQLAKNLFIKLTNAEDDQLITNQLKELLTTIRYKTFYNKARHENELINQIADLVIGY